DLHLGAAPAAPPRGRLGRDPGREVAAGDDHRHPPPYVGEREIEQNGALLIGEQELLGVVGEDADAVAPLVDHAVEHPALAVEVEIAVVTKRRRRDRHHAPDRFVTGRHGGILPMFRRCPITGIVCASDHHALGLAAKAIRFQDAGASLRVILPPSLPTPSSGAGLMWSGAALLLVAPKSSSRSWKASAT